MISEESALARTGSEQGFAGVVLFLVSQAGAYMNETVIPFNGGWLAQMPGSH